MTQFDKQPVALIDLGADVMRSGIGRPSGLQEHESVPTPQCPEELFRLLGRQLLDLNDKYDTQYAAIGLPGPVRSHSGDITLNGSTVGPLPNIAGMTDAFDLKESLTGAEPAIKALTLIALNNVQAAAYAAADEHADDNNQSPLLLVGLGRGIGSEVIVDYETMRHKARHLKELGHSLFRQPDGSYKTLERLISGEALLETYGQTAKNLYDNPDTQDIWDEVGRTLAQAFGFAIPDVGMSKIVVCGWLGANCNERFGPAMHAELDIMMEALPPHITAKPEVIFVSPEKDKTMGRWGGFLAVKRLFLRQ